LQPLLLGETREPLHTLEPGQRKGIQNQRVTLVGGPRPEVAVIQRIFHEFTVLGYVALPRWLVGTNTFRVSPGSARVDMFGCSDLEFLEQPL
jgi:hypothetical protein